MSKRKLPKTFNRRKHHTPRVARRVSINPKPIVNTVFGPETITPTKFCTKCSILQPLDNFYVVPNFTKKNLDENDPKSRRKNCCICYDKLNR